MDIGGIIAGVIGVAGTLAGKKVTQVVTGADSKIVGAIKPFQPAIAFGLTLVLPKVCGVIGISSCPSGEALASAPLGIIGGIVALELAKKVKLSK